MYKAVIFDLDGTLLNTLDDLADSTNFALEKNGFPTRTIDEVRRFVGNGNIKLIHRALPIRQVRLNFKKHIQILQSIIKPIWQIKQSLMTV